MGTWNELIYELGGAGSTWNDAGTDKWGDHTDVATEVKCTRFTSDTSTGTQDITISDFGTPQAVFFLYNGSTLTGNGTTDNAIRGLGCTHGTIQWSHSNTDEHGVTTSDTSRRVEDGTCIEISNDNNTMQAKAVFSAWITDGIRINWTTNNLGTGVPITAIFINGATNVYCGLTTLSTQNTTIDITSPGFEPDLVFVAQNAYSSYSSVNNDSLSVGAAINDGSATQKCLSRYISNFRGNGTYGARVISNRIGAKAFTGTVWSVELSDFDANGFSLTARDGDSLSTKIPYFAIKTEKDVWVDTIDSPTSTGNASVTGVGFEPDFVFMAESLIQTVDTLSESGDAGSWGLSVFDGTNEYTHVVAGEDDSAVMDTESGCAEAAVSFNMDDGSAGFDATYVSMDNDGWTLNYSAVSGTARKWVAIAIGTQAAGELDIAIAQHHYKMLSNQ